MSYYWVICSKYRKFEKHKISYFLEKRLVFSVICSKRKNEDDRFFKKVILGCTIIGYISISVFSSLIGIPIGIGNSVIGFKIFAVDAGIKKYKSIIKKEKNK